MTWQHGGVRRTGITWATVVAGLVVAGPLPAIGQTLRYWDIDGQVPGAGGPTPSGTWDSSAANWSPAEAGDVATEAWQAGQFAVFSAGTDAIGSFNVTLTGTNSAAGVTVRQGTVNLVGSGTLVLDTGTLTVASGARLTVNSYTRLSQTTGGLIVLDGGAIENTAAGTGGTFLQPFIISGTLQPSGNGIMATANGGTLVYSGTGATVYRGNLLGEGGTTLAGTNTFTKTGQGEFRIEGPNAANFTFEKLVVREGLYRLSATGGNAPETGFGAQPPAPLADAITLDGGGIGASYNLQLDGFRGITLGAGGGVLNATAGALTVPTPIAGAGPLRVIGTRGITLLADGTRTGGTTIGSDLTMTGGITPATAGTLTIFGDGGLGAVPTTLDPANIRLGTATASGTLTISNNDTVIAANRGIEVGAAGGTLNSSRRIEYAGVLSGSGALTKASTGTLVLSGSNTISGGLRSVGGGVVEVAADANLGAVPGATQNDAVVLADATSSGRLRVTESFTMPPTRGITLNAGGTSTPLGGTIDVATGRTLTIGGPISGSGRFTKSGTGTLVLAGTNSYAGTTTVSAGTLVVHGAITGTSAVSLQGGTTLAGSGSIGGSVTVGSFTTLAPGSSPGTLSIAGNVTLGSGGNYNWQIYDAGGTAGSSTGWDLLSVGGTLAITATTESRFNLNLWSLSGVGPDVNGPAINWNSTQSGSWRIASAAGGITGFSADKFTINTTAANGAAGFANALAGGIFSLAQVGNDLNLVFTASGPAAITIDVPSGTQTQAQAGHPTISTAASVTKIGAGTVVFDAANAYNGPTTVSAGTLQVANADALAATAVTVGAGATLAVAPGTTMKSPSVTVNGGTLSGGTVAVNTATGIQALTINAGTVASSTALVVGPGGLVDLPDAARVTIGVTSLAVDQAPGGGKIDLGAGELRIAAGGITAAALRADIIAGSNGGAWNGATGITSGTAAASGGTRAVGYVVDGAGAARVSFAAPGDTTLDGQVDLLDLLEILGSGTYEAPVPSIWSQGDFNYDGTTDLLDLLAILGSGTYDQGPYLPGAPVAPSLTAVPEPAMAAWVGVAVACAAAGWRRAGRARRRCPT